jgi:hypothetical protein
MSLHNKRLPVTEPTRRQQEASRSKSWEEDPRAQSRASSRLFSRWTKSVGESGKGVRRGTNQQGLVPCFIFCGDIFCGVVCRSHPVARDRPCTAAAARPAVSKSLSRAPPNRVRVVAWDAAPGGVSPMRSRPLERKDYAICDCWYDRLTKSVYAPCACRPAAAHGGGWPRHERAGRNNQHVAPRPFVRMLHKGKGGTAPLCAERSPEDASGGWGLARLPNW